MKFNASSLPPLLSQEEVSDGLPAACSVQCLLLFLAADVHFHTSNLFVKSCVKAYLKAPPPPVVQKADELLHHRIFARLKFCQTSFSAILKIL
jgi:hypothetical protein